MRRVLVGVIILLLVGPAAVAQEDEVPEPFKSLAGGWVRAARTPDGEVIRGSLLTGPNKDGIDVLPELKFVDDLKPLLRGLSPADRRRIRQMLGGAGHWSLVVGAGPVIGSVGPQCYSSHRATPDGKSKGTLLLDVGGKKVRLEYKLEKDTLTIQCNEPLPAGSYIERMNVSGTWVRLR
jgi:hypothetical protein